MVKIQQDLYRSFGTGNGCFIHTMAKQFTITKKIAKHGKQAILVIPRVLENELKPSTLVKITFDVIEEAEK